MSRWTIVLKSPWHVKPAGLCLGLFNSAKFNEYVLVFLSSAVLCKYIWEYPRLWVKGVPVATNKRVCEELRVFEKCNVTTVTAGLGMRPVWNWPGEQELSKCSPGHCYSTSATCDHNNTIFANAALCFTVTLKGKVSFLSVACVCTTTQMVLVYINIRSSLELVQYTYTQVYFSLNLPRLLLGSIMN